MPYDTLSTRTLNSPEYIAYDATYEYSVTFSHSCTTGLPALRHISNKQCVTALFEGNAHYIERLCTVVYAKQHEYSTAQYIYINNTATLATQSSRLANDVWRMGYVHPSKGTITRTTIRPCLLCKSVYAVIVHCMVMILMYQCDYIIVRCTHPVHRLSIFDNTLI